MAETETSTWALCLTQQLLWVLYHMCTGKVNDTRPVLGRNEFLKKGLSAKGGPPPFNEAQLLETQLTKETATINLDPVVLELEANLSALGGGGFFDSIVGEENTGEQETCEIHKPF